MTATVLAPYLKSRFVDANGAALYLGTVSTFQAGTTTPIVTYKDSTGIATNTNPIVLNPRGECDIFLLNNVAYKFQVNDALGNLIWTEDNIVNSALLTLYGGVDTGSTNAFILNFTASFTAYVDGIVLYWIPSHNNTGASTINVNGLGVVNITNQDGTALSSGQLHANQTATIMFKAGAFLLLATGNVPLSGSFVGALTGLSSGSAVTINYFLVGRLCMLLGAGTGPSNSTSLTLTGLPAVVTPTSGAIVVPCALFDNGAFSSGWATVQSSTGIITFGNGASNNPAGFTNGGPLKGLTTGWSISYPIFSP